jgi:ribosomal protein S18 acetylase RimI-like enzyme
MMVIRDMTAADLDAVSLLAEQLVVLHHSWDTTRFFTTPDVAKGYRRYFQSQLTEEGVLLLTAEVDGAVGGYLFGTLESRDWAKLLDAHGAIHDVYVASSHRRLGVAQALMNEAKVRFQKLGAKQVVLYSASANLEGQSLFKRLGYRPTMVEMTLDLPG